MGPVGQLVQNKPNLAVIARHGHDELLVQKCLQRYCLFPAQGMIRRHQGPQPVPAQGNPLESLALASGVQAQLRLAAGHDLLNGIGTSLDDLNFHMGIILLKIPDDARQPVGRHAGVRGDADAAGVRPLDLGNILFQGLVGVQQLADDRQQHLALAVGLDAGRGPHHQRKPHFLLQRLHHMADAGLGVPQLLRRLGKAPQLYSPYKRLAFANIHGCLPFGFLMSLFPLCLYFHGISFFRKRQAFFAYPAKS